MRLHRDSLTVQIIERLWCYGQLPYTSLQFLNCDYEWAKDCVQKLIKENYVGVIKDTNLKSLYLKPDGIKAWVAYCKRVGKEVDPEDKPTIVYNADKARRTERVNEAQLLADAAGFHKVYFSSPDVKSRLEEEAARQSDNIKYSRFAGILCNKSGGMLLYHFGKGNLHLNANGERSARTVAGRFYRELGGKEFSPYFPMLVLGNSTDTAQRILDYSDMLGSKPKGEWKHMRRRHFNLPEFEKIFGDILFLPITAETPQMLRVLAFNHKDSLYKLPGQYSEPGTHVVNLLECRLNLWRNYRDLIPRDKPVAFFYYKWQESLLVKYFAEPLQLENAQYWPVNIGFAMKYVSASGKV